MKTMINELAFPFSGIPTDGTDIPWMVLPQPGMSLRDYFAAKAMQAMLSNTDALTQILTHIEIKEADGRRDMLLKVVARRAYHNADAMLQERNKYSQEKV